MQLSTDVRYSRLRLCCFRSVQLSFPDSGPMAHDCRTLLDERWVLTAAHCCGTGVASLDNIQVWCEDIPIQFKALFVNFCDGRILLVIELCLKAFTPSI